LSKNVSSLTVSCYTIFPSFPQSHFSHRKKSRKIENKTIKDRWREEERRGKKKSRKGRQGKVQEKRGERKDIALKNVLTLSMMHYPNI
jgi:hypothetical protein